MRKKLKQEKKQILMKSMKNKSRFDFVSEKILNNSVEVPLFISTIINNHFLLLKEKKEDAEKTWDRNLVLEYTENNHWAKFLVHVNNPKKTELLKDIELEEEIKMLNKFKTL